MQSPLYWSPGFYSFIMKRLYGSYYSKRYSAIAQIIPDNCSLFELCMGDLYFYKHYLKKKNINYSCADINPIFVNAAKKEGINAVLIDILKDEIPNSDYILLQGSLYHSIPHQKELVKKILGSTGKQLIISENVLNISNSSNHFKAWLGGTFSKAKAGQSKIKFTRETLKESFKDFEKEILQWIETPDNLETIIVLEKKSGS